MPLDVRHRTGWVEVRLDRPPRNVLDREMLVRLVETLDELAAREDPPVLLLSSHGRHFSTGYSIRDIPEEIFHRDPAIRATAPFEMVMQRLVDYPAPVVARVQGDAYGGAVELLACADLRTAADGVRLGTPPVRLGLVYSHSGLRRMIRTFGSNLARELFLTGEVIDAERAARAGFFHRIAALEELDAVTDELIESVVRGGRQALRGTRRILNLLEETETLPAEALAEIGRLRHESWSSEEFIRAREEFLGRSRGNGADDAREKTR